MKNTITIVLIAIGFQFTDSSFAEIYKCKTTSGQTTYSSKQCLGVGETLTLQKESLPEQTIIKPSVDIYVTNWCPYCKKTLAYFRSKNIAFNAYDIEKSYSAKTKKQELVPGYEGIPLTVINGKIIKGFSVKRFEKALSTQ